jgi:hypothetical protein
MKTLENLLADSRKSFGHGWSLPEYRQIELYTKRKKLAFRDPPPAPEYPAGTLGVHVAALLLESFLAGRDAALLEGRSSWERYLALPRRTATDKLVAEVYRILRVFRVAATHRDGHLELEDGLVRAACTFQRCALALNITPAGLGLLESFVHVYLDSFRQPYGEAYVERLLMQYFVDIVGEIRKFADEDRILYQFRPYGFFNRHFRLDCDNPRYEAGDGRYRFEIGATYADPVRYPIDFFVVLQDTLHIVPVEALRDGGLPESELPRWRTRDPFGTELPAEFRRRFAREVMVVGLPMT